MASDPMSDARITNEMLDYFEGQANHVSCDPVFVEVDPLNMLAMIREIREGRAASRPATSPETCPTCGSSDEPRPIAPDAFSEEPVWCFNPFHSEENK